MRLYCNNHNYGGGADDTGGNSGSEQNFWWVPWNTDLHGPLPAPETIPPCSDVSDEDYMCARPNASDLTEPNCCVRKETHFGESLTLMPNAGILCVGSDWPATLAPPFDPLDDEDEWVSGSYPRIDDEARQECSQICESRNAGAGTPPTSCEDDQWSILQTEPNWTPAQGFNCPEIAELNVEDPDGSEIPWYLVGGPTAPAPLECSLIDDCADWLFPHVRGFVLNPGIAGFIEPETRAAHYLAVEGSGSSIELDIDASGSGAGVDDTEPLYGLAEFSATECGDAVCPFYLGNLIAYNTTDIWEVRLETAPTGRLNKTVSDVQIDLMQSTLGVRHMALDKVAFAPGSLRLRVQVTIANNGSGSTFGNGTHAAIIENDDVVFADYDDGAITLTHTFAFQNAGEATLTVHVVPAEHPPVSLHDLNTTEACDDQAGLILDDTRTASTDPDNDIVGHSWWIDDIPCGSVCVAPFGAHRISLETRDSRGAAVRSADQWVYVAPGCL